jgi:hypothetical protein
LNRFLFLVMLQSDDSIHSRPYRLLCSICASRSGSKLPGLSSLVVRVVVVVVFESFFGGGGGVAVASESPLAMVSDPLVQLSVSSGSCSASCSGGGDTTEVPSLLLSGNDDSISPSSTIVIGYRGRQGVVGC